MIYIKQKNKSEIENLESEILRLKATSNELLNQLSEPNNSQIENKGFQSL